VCCSFDPTLATWLMRQPSAPVMPQDDSVDEGISVRRSTGGGSHGDGSKPPFAAEARTAPNRNRTNSQPDLEYA
jgi:hypothetical protein